VVRFQSELTYFIQTLNPRNNGIYIPLNYKFFGITAEYKQKLHTEIFDLLYCSKGSFNHSDIYNMPIALRTFYIKRLLYHLEEEKKAAQATKSRRSR